MGGGFGGQQAPAAYPTFGGSVPADVGEYTVIVTAGGKALAKKVQVLEDVWFDKMLTIASGFGIRDSGFTGRRCGDCRGLGRSAIVGYGSNDAGAHDASDAALRLSAGVARRAARHADAARVPGSVQSRRDRRSSSWPSSTRFPSRGSRRWPTACSTTTTSGAPARAGRLARARWRSSCTSSAKWRWSSACGPSCWGSPSCCGTGSAR